MKGYENRKLAALMTLYGITREELCHEIGLSESQFTRKRLGSADFKESEMQAIWDLFKTKDEHISITDIFF